MADSARFEDGWYIVPWQVIFRDVDAFGHVNNAVYLTYFEWARAQLWFALTGAAGLPTDIGFIVARAAIDFKLQIEMEPMHGEMVVFEPPSLLELAWGGDRLRFELEADGDGTKLTFTVTMDELGKATRDGAGWHQSLESLGRSLAGEPRRPNDSGHWRERRDR